MTTPVTYCTLDDVAALTMYTRGRHFFDAALPDYTHLAVVATNPSLSTVTGWILQISRMMDAALAQFWFNVPVPASNTDVTTLLAAPVARIVADMCDDANSAGRFYSERVVENGLSKMSIITRDLYNFVESNQDGLVALGLAQHQTPASKTIVNIRTIGASYRSRGTR